MRLGDFYRCILLQRKKCWKCAFQHTPTYSIEPLIMRTNNTNGNYTPRQSQVPVPDNPKSDWPHGTSFLQCCQYSRITAASPFVYRLLKLPTGFRKRYSVILT